MELLTADNPRDTAIAWGFVLGQFALLLTVLALPVGDAWVAPDGVLLVARWVGWAGMAVLIVGLTQLRDAIG